MSEYDIHTELQADNALDATTIATDTATNGEIIDTALFDSLEFIPRTGDYTDGDYAFSMEHGDDSGLADASAVTAEETIGVAAVLAEANAVTRVGYIGKKQFVRLITDSTNTSTGADLSAIAIQSNAHHMPVADQ